VVGPMAVGWPRKCVDSGASFQQSPTEPQKLRLVAMVWDAKVRRIGNGAEVEGETEA
jgi:hypothetical protein